MAPERRELEAVAAGQLLRAERPYHWADRIGGAAGRGRRDNRRDMPQGLDQRRDILSVSKKFAVLIAIGDAADCLLRGVVALAARAPDDPARRVFAYRGAERPDEHAGERGGTLVAGAQLSATQRRCRA